MPRARLLGLAVAVAVFATALAGAWVLLTPSGASEPPASHVHRVYFGYQNTPLRASIATTWRRAPEGRLASGPEGIALRSRCVDTAMFSYLSRNWRESPVRAASLILTGTFAEQSASNVRAVSRTATSALVVDAAMEAITLVRRSGRRDYTTLVAQFEQRQGCSRAGLAHGLRELRDMVDSFRVEA